jgi:hypothetical protein
MTAKPLLYMEGIALVTRLYSVCNWPWPPFAMGTPLGVTMRNRKAIIICPAKIIQYRLSLAPETPIKDQPAAAPHR